VNTKKPAVSKKTSPVVEIKPHTLHKPVVPVEQQNIQVNNLKTLKNKVEYNKWVKKIHKDKLFNIERKKPIGNNIPVMNKKQITEITSNNVPDDTISLVTYMPYNDDIDYKGVKFYKLGTCSKTCQNKGIFAKNDLDNMLIHGYNSCPLCKEPYDLTNIPNKPPFGIMSYRVYNDGKIKWHNIHFDLYYDKYKRIQNAYYPICDEGDLVLWLICEAWKNGKLFTMGYTGFMII
jgi:hypothetical protein